MNEASVMITRYPCTAPVKPAAAFGAEVWSEPRNGRGVLYDTNGWLRWGTSQQLRDGKSLDDLHRFAADGEIRAEGV